MQPELSKVITKWVGNTDALITDTEVLCKLIENAKIRNCKKSGRKPSSKNKFAKTTSRRLPVDVPINAMFDIKSRESTNTRGSF